MCACVKIDLRRILAALAGCAACVFLAACSTVDAVTRQPVRTMYTVQEDVSMGRSAVCAMIDYAVSRFSSAPSARRPTAFGTARRIGSGDGITAASTTAGCSNRVDTSSNGELR